MNIVDRATIIQFHRARIQNFGCGTEGALGWKTPASQTSRFDVLAGIADLNDRSVLDVGCGHGDLRAWLGELYPRVRYYGIDQMKEFLDVAVKRYGSWPSTKFFLGDFSSGALPEADFVLASGALGYRNADPEFQFKMIERFYTTCRIGCGFNMQSRVEYPEGILAACNAVDILAYCRTLSSKVVFREEYLADDFTVMMYR